MGSEVTEHQVQTDPPHSGLRCSAGCSPSFSFPLSLLLVAFVVPLIASVTDAENGLLSRSFPDTATELRLRSALRVRLILLLEVVVFLLDVRKLHQDVDVEAAASSQLNH
ncbi:uncharacterized protein V6R79_001686 [Siganus canaliculatus]